MDKRMKKSLDRHITGNYGEDQFSSTLCDEFIITLDDKQIRCPAYPEPCDYLRITDLEGNEVVYWHYDEWADDPMTVMGAILGAIGNPLTKIVLNPFRQKPENV